MAAGSLSGNAKSEARPRLVRVARRLLRGVFAVARKLTSDPPPDIAGFVERIDPTLISGWAYSRTGRPFGLTVRVNGHEYSQDVAWTERVDVANGAGAVALNSGFRIVPAEALKSALSREGLEGSAVDILADGRLLPKVERAFLPQHPASEALAIRTESGALRAEVESWRPFVLRGWIAAPGGRRAALELRVDGAPLECSIVRLRQEDLADPAGAPAARAGFEIELPGYLWESARHKDSCVIEVRADGHSITPAPLALSREKIVDWVREIAGLGEGPQRQYFALLALEHLRYGAFFQHLDDGTKGFVRGVARKMRLEDFVFVEIEDRVKAVDVPAEDPSSLQLGAAMRDLNAVLKGSGGEKFEAIRTVLKQHKLRGAAKQWYNNLAVQITSTSGEFARVRRSLDVAHLYPFETSSQPRLLSLLLPLLVTEGEILRAAETLRRLSKELARDWFHSECIAYSVREVQRLEREGSIATDAAEAFRDAVVGVLEAFEGEWFSRLHDRELVDAMAAIAADIGRYGEDHRRSMAAAAIRHYGLCPTFWQRLGPRSRDLPDDDLRRAAAAWERVRDGLLRRDPGIPARLEALVEPLVYFHRQRNPEAIMFLRELAANSLPELERMPAGAASALISALIEADPAEGMRVRAFPLAGEAALQARFPEIGERLLHTLRQLDQYPASPAYDAQRAAAAALRAAQEAARGRDAAAWAEALAEVERSATALADATSRFLGADVLASACAAAADAGFATGALAGRVADLVRGALGDPATAALPPAAIGSAIARLAGLADDAAARSLVEEIGPVLRDRFELPLEALAGQSAARALSIAGKGWPGDTLVAIFSSREHLGTHVQAIRESWARDLEARGIPFVFVVGGGEGVLRGDVLELDASDHYEDRPRKTLALIEWVSRRSDAQYLLKINDDCHLDVARYFDTLSYRKHAYYGRVVRCDTGTPGRASLDRTRHHEQAHSLRGRRALDKSPEPADYADGDAGYCLSRPALLKLGHAAATGEGQRLVGRSFREDKLVGDLLALCHISPDEEDYAVHRRRRLFSGATPVAMGENTFLPSPLTPTKVVHLDGCPAFAETRRLALEPALRPRKIWPTCAKPKIKANSNQLELLTEPGKVRALLGEDPVVVSVVRNERVMAPHFLAHYRKLGVKCFIFVDNCSDDGTREYLLSQPDAAVYSVDTEYKRSHYGVTWQQAVLGNHCLGKWVLLADADEFLVYESCETVPLADLARSIDAEQRDGALVYMIDMYPYGDLGEARFEQGDPFALAPYFDRDALIELRFGGGSYSNSRNFVNGLRHRIAPSRINAYVSQKYALFRHQPWIRLAEGVHYAADISIGAKPVFFAHFKYHSGFKSKVLTEVSRNQHFNGAEEYRRYIAMLAEGMGGFGAEGVTERYRDSRSFLALLEKL